MTKFGFSRWFHHFNEFLDFSENDFLKNIGLVKHISSVNISDNFNFWTALFSKLITKVMLGRTHAQIVSSQQS